VCVCVCVCEEGGYSSLVLFLRCRRQERKESERGKERNSERERRYLAPIPPPRHAGHQLGMPREVPPASGAGIGKVGANGRGGFVRLGGELLLLHGQGRLLGLETALFGGEGARGGVVGGIDGRGLAPRLLLPSDEASAAVLCMRLENLELLEIKLRREIERWATIGGSWGWGYGEAQRDSPVGRRCSGALGGFVTPK
jgi:hypothetical protein